MNLMAINLMDAVITVRPYMRPYVRTPDQRALPVPT